MAYKVQQIRFSGQQTVPIRAIIETEKDFLWLVEKEEEFGLFRMHWETLSAFGEFCVASTPCLIRQLPHLTHEELALFLHLVENNLRLETATH